ncbi:hypothetical protein BS17DRAFT_436728 [Gyrodon lividus]|nr:hypothetical protein BS17DRAFT_436728 [Gyrodon lividus]
MASSNSETMVPLEGPVGVGMLVDSILLGCALMQSCLYYKNAREDRWLQKGLVALILFFLITHFGCSAIWLWANTRVDIANTAEPTYATVAFGISKLFGAILLFVERCFFARRVSKLSNNRLLTFIFAVLCAFTFAVALVAATVFFTPVATDLTSQLSQNWIFPLAIISALVCDLTMSIAIALYLKGQAPFGVTHTGGIVNLLFLWAAETCIVTSFIDIATALTYWLARTNFAWVGLFALMPGVFANSLLAALNVRGRLFVHIEHQSVINVDNKLINQKAKHKVSIVFLTRATDITLLNYRSRQF